MSEAHKQRLEELKSKPSRTPEEEQEVKSIEEYLSTLEPSIPKKEKVKKKKGGGK